MRRFDLIVLSDHVALDQLLQVQRILAPEVVNLIMIGGIHHPARNRQRTEDRPRATSYVQDVLDADTYDARRPKERLFRYRHFGSIYGHGVWEQVDWQYDRLGACKQLV